MTTTATALRMGFTQDFIARVFDLSFSEQEKARIGDTRRERNARNESR